MKSSPVNIADSAVHLEIVIDASGEIEYSALMATGRNGNIFDFSRIVDCQVEYQKEETFVARSLLHSLKTGNSEGTTAAAAVSFPTAKEFNETSMKEFSDLLEKLKKTASADSLELLKHLPDATAYAKQSEKFKTELKGIHELVKLLCDQLGESQKLYTNHSE